MSTKTTFKRISLVAVAALGFGMLSVVPSSATSGATTLPVAILNTTTTGASTAPIAAGSNISAELRITTNAITVAADSITANYEVLNPNGDAVACTFSETTTAAFQTNNNSTLTGSTFTISVETAAVTAAVGFGNVLCPTTIGGIYKINAKTISVGGGMTSAATQLNLANDIYVSGIAVTQGTLKGVTAGTAVTGNSSKVKVFFPKHTASETYKVVSSGVGSITGKTDVTGSSTTISGTADASSGYLYTNAADTVWATMELSLTSAVAGVQTISVQAIDAGTGVASALYSATVTWGPVAAAASTLADATSTSIIAKGAIANSAQTVDSATVTAPMAAGTQAATIYVTQKSAITTAVPNESMTVTISGPGLLGTGAYNAAATGRALLVKNTEYVSVWPDGSAGVATIKIVGTTSGVTLGTETVTFYGAATKLVATLTTDASTTAGVGSTKTTSLTITATDAAAVLATNPSGLTVASSDTAVATVAISGNNTVTITGVKAGTATITVTDPATTAAATAATYTITVKANKSLTAPTVTFDKTSYAVGELVTMTVGAAMADSATAQLFTSTGLVLSYAVVASGTAIPANGQHAIVDGVATYKFYAPAVSGSFSVTGTAGSAIDLTTLVTAPVVTKTIDITNAAADAATAAGEAAEAAAQDATDAALDATTAAEAAGALAQEAVDLVTELSAEVTKLIAGVRASITYLTKLVMKLAAKK